MKRAGFVAGSLVAVFLFVAAASAQPQIRLDPFITTGLTSPLFMVEPPGGARISGGRYLIVQQGGRIMFGNLRQAPSVFIDLASPTHNRVLSGGERGLLGLALHPQYNSNRRFFVYYTRQTDGAITIAEYRTSPTNPNVADPATERVIITIPHPGASNHNGGTVAFGPDGYLYAGPGDGGGGNDPSNNAQNINTLLGKIIRIDVDSPPSGGLQYAIPPDNPFAGATPGRDEIYAVGMRNPYRFSFDRGGTNQLWAADVGQGQWEEVDIVENGGNYGWRVYEGNQCTGLDPALCIPANFEFPIFQYSITGARCAIIGGFVYRGSRGTFPPGSYVYGDYCTGEIILWDGNSQTLLLDTAFNIVGFAEDRTGEIYVVGQSAVQKIVPLSDAPADGILVEQN